MLNPAEVGSDDWMLMRLLTKLGQGLPRMYRLRSYRDGEAILPEEALGADLREAYLRFARLNRLHVVELLRDARTSKQKIVGFRTAAPGDDDGDAEAWRLWRGSYMHSRQTELFNDVADFGRAYLITDWPKVGEAAAFRVSDDTTCAVEVDPQRPWLVRAAVEVGYNQLTESDEVTFWRVDDAGRVYMRLAVRHVGEYSQIPADGSVWSPTPDWDWQPVAGSDFTSVPFSSVPVKPVSTPSGVGVWERHLDTIDRINYTTLQLMQIVVTQAFRQAAVSGDLPSTYPADDPDGRAGQLIDYSQIFRLGPAALWRLPPDGKLQEFSPVDPRPIKELRDDDIRKLAAFSATPYYMLSSDSANNSAEGASLASDLLLSKIGDMNTAAEIGISQAVGLAFEAMGDSARADAAGIECIWSPLKRSSLAEIGSAASQAKAGGATQRWIDERVFGMTPLERAQAKADRESEQMMAALGDAGA